MKTGSHRQLRLLVWPTKGFMGEMTNETDFASKWSKDLDLKDLSTAK